MHDCLIERYFLEEENSWKFCYALLIEKKTVGKISTNKKLSLTLSRQLQVCLSMYNLFVDTRRWRL